MPDGSFSAAARAIIYGRSLGRCVGCGSSQVTAQHRRARGMGGTSQTLGHEYGVALCGSGTTGCHGWAEHNPADAELLGWRLPRGADPLEVPYWDQAWASLGALGFRMIEPDGMHHDAEISLDGQTVDLAGRVGAVVRFHSWRDRRA